MKFDLAPDNRDQPDDVLLEDLRSVADRLGVKRLTREAYGKAGRFSPATIAARFSGWGRAVRLAGLDSSRHFGVTREECIEDLRRVAGQLQRKELSVAEYQRQGRFSQKPFNRHFGGWIDALNAAGLDVSDQFHPRASTEDLFENLEAAWERLGRQPTVNDMFPPVSRFSAHLYKRRFGGFRKALELFVAASQQPAVSIVPAGTARAGQQIDPVVSPPTRPSGNRSIGWRLRYVVLSRDRFSCRACGRSPARDLNTVLEVDHVVPWSAGGATVESNLQTLCDQCNGGKG